MKFLQKDVKRRGFEKRKLGVDSSKVLSGWELKKRIDKYGLKSMSLKIHRRSSLLDDIKDAITEPYDE